MSASQTGGTGLPGVPVAQHGLRCIGYGLRSVIDRSRRQPDARVAA